MSALPCTSLEDTPIAAFRPINAGYDAVFTPGQLSLGLVIPVEHYPGGPVPTIERHIERAQLAEALGFAAVWLRDVPFNVPSFGDAGQLFDPFVYLGVLAARTSDIALGVSSIVLPLRHPAHVAKAAATADVLSNGRLILGIASGDRPEEFPALNLPFGRRGSALELVSEVEPARGYTYTMISRDPGNDQTGRIRLEPLPDGGTRLHFEERYHLTRAPWKWLEGPIYRFINRKNEASMRALSEWLSRHPEYRPDLARAA